MADGQWESVVQELRRIAGLQEAAGLPDGRLVEVFAATGEPAALEALVRRYGPMVFGVCRRVLRHAQDAEDAFQATFMVLVRKAASLRRGDAVGNWLFGVAYRTALQARAKSSRRRRIEAEAPPMADESSTVETAAQLELQALLDRELNRLPDKYRAAIILCDLLGKTKKQAAVELGCPEGTVSSRLARGRDILRKKLARHSPALTETAAPLTALGQTFTHALPVGLCGATIKAAALVAKGTTIAAALSPSVAGLVQGVMKSMLITKLKPVVMVLAGFALLGGMTYVVASGVGRGKGDDNNLDKREAERPAIPLIAEREASPAIQEQPPPKKEGFPREKLRYDGKDFSAWLEIFQSELKPQKKVEAIKALRMFVARGYAEEVTTAMLAELKLHRVATGFPEGWGNYYQVIEAAKSALCDTGDLAIAALAKELQSNKLNDRRIAVSCLGARPTIPDMPELGGGIGLPGLPGLPGGGEPGFSIMQAEPLLLKALRDEDSWVRTEALSLIVWISKGPVTYEFASKPSAEVRKGLVKILASVIANEKSDWSNPDHALIVLGWLAPESGAALPTVVKVLEDFESRHLQARAAQTISQIGPTAREAVTILIRLLGGAVEPDKPKVQPPGTHDYSESREYLYAIKALGAIGPDAEAAVPVLLGILQREAKTGTSIVDRKLDPFVNDPDEIKDVTLREEAARALAKLGREGVTALIKTVSLGLSFPEDRDPDPVSFAVPKFAIAALGELGPAGKNAVPTLVQIVEQRKLHSLDYYAAIALGKIGPDAKEAVPVIVKRLETERDNKIGRWKVTEKLVQALGEIGPAANSAIPILTELRDAKTFGAFDATELRQLNRAAAKALEKIQK